MPQSLNSGSKVRLSTALKQGIRTLNWKVVLVMVLITGAACSFIYYRRIALPADSDYGSYILFAQNVLYGHGIDAGHLSHPLLQLVLAGMHLASWGKLGTDISLIILQVLSQILTVLILYTWIGKSERKYWDWLRAGAAVTLTFVAPIMLPAFWDGKFYYGYIGLANYHNPTVHLLKPLAMLSLIYAAGAITGEHSRWKSIAMAAVINILSAWLKPSYLVAFLPALGLVIVIRLIQRRPLDWRMLLFGFYLPVLPNLLAQWIIAYYGKTGAGITLAPFLVVSAYSQHLALKFFLSTLFPIIILFIARRELLKDSTLLIGWTGFLIGAAQSYLLIEGGKTIMDGDFLWSSQIMLFLLFAVTTRWALREKLPASGVRLSEKIIIISAYLAHLAAGIAYYIYCMISIHYS